VEFLSHAISAKPSKSFFCHEKVLYLGHVISAEDLSTDLEKIKAVKGYPKPSFRKEVMSFLELVAYYRNFVQAFAEVAAPLTDSLKKDRTPFYWTPEMDHAFHQLRTALCTAPILPHPDFSMLLKITTDASEVRLGAVLNQEKPEGKVVIQFPSKRLPPPECRLIAAEREALAIIWACDVFRPYIIGTKFVLETDNQAVPYMTSGKPTGELARWALKLQEFHFDINHRKGTCIAHVDALSRQPVGTDEELDLLMIDEDLMSTRDVFEVSADSDPERVRWCKQFSQIQREDPKLKDVFDNILRHEVWARDCEIQDGILFMKEAEGNRLVIPKTQRVHCFEHFIIRLLENIVAYQRRIPESEILPIGVECLGMSKVGLLVLFLVSEESFLRTRDEAFSRVQLLKLQITQYLSISWGHSRSLPVASSIFW
jgi:hypothetical protein